MCSVEFKLSSKSMCYVEFTQNCKSMCSVEFKLNSKTMCFVEFTQYCKVRILSSSSKTVIVCDLLSSN